MQVCGFFYASVDIITFNFSMVIQRIIVIIPKFCQIIMQIDTKTYFGSTNIS